MRANRGTGVTAVAEKMKEEARGVILEARER